MCSRTSVSRPCRVLLSFHLRYLSRLSRSLVDLYHPFRELFAVGGSFKTAVSRTNGAAYWRAHGNVIIRTYWRTFDHAVINASGGPSSQPSSIPSNTPSTSVPTALPPGRSSGSPSTEPSASSSCEPSAVPSGRPASSPSSVPTTAPSSSVPSTALPTAVPSSSLIALPTAIPSPSVPSTDGEPYPCTCDKLSLLRWAKQTRPLRYPYVCQRSRHRAHRRRSRVWLVAPTGPPSALQKPRIRRAYVESGRESRTEMRLRRTTCIVRALVCDSNIALHIFAYESTSVR